MLRYAYTLGIASLLALSPLFVQQGKAKVAPIQPPTADKLDRVTPAATVDGEITKIEGVQVRIFDPEIVEIIQDPAKVIVLDEKFTGKLPENLKEYQVEIKDLPVGKFLSILKSSNNMKDGKATIVLKGDAGELRIGQALVEGDGLVNLVEAMPEIVEGIQVKKSNTAQGQQLIVLSKAGNVTTIRDLTRVKSGPTMVTANLGDYLAKKGEDGKANPDEKIKALRDAINKAIELQAKAGNKKLGQPQVEVHAPTNLLMLVGQPEEVAVSTQVLEALGLKVAGKAQATVSDELYRRGLAPAAVAGFDVFSSDAAFGPARFASPPLPPMPPKAVQGYNIHVDKVQKEVEKVTKEAMSAADRAKDEAIKALKSELKKAQEELEKAKKATKDEE